MPYSFPAFLVPLTFVAAMFAAVGRGQELFPCSTRVVEPTSGERIVLVEVLSGEVLTEEIEVEFTTEQGTASAGDFTPTTGSVTLSAGASGGVIEVPVLADRESESPETFLVRLTSASKGKVIGEAATVTIHDAYAGLTFETKSDSTEITESDAMRDGASPLQVTGPVGAFPHVVRFRNFDDTAEAGTDYSPSTGTLEAVSSDGSVGIPFVITGDELNRGERSFYQTLDTPHALARELAIDQSFLLPVFAGENIEIGDQYAVVTQLGANPPLLSVFGRTDNRRWEERTVIKRPVGAGDDFGNRVSISGRYLACDDGESFWLFDLGAVDPGVPVKAVSATDGGRVRGILEGDWLIVAEWQPEGTVVVRDYHRHQNGADSWGVRQEFAAAENVLADPGETAAWGDRFVLTTQDPSGESPHQLRVFQRNPSTHEWESDGNILEAASSPEIFNDILAWSTEGVKLYQRQPDGIWEEKVHALNNTEVHLGASTLVAYGSGDVGLWRPERDGDGWFRTRLGYSVFGGLAVYDHDGSLMAVEGDQLVVRRPVVSRVRISDDEGITIALGDAEEKEGGVITLAIVLSAPFAVPVTVSGSIESLSATENVDYTGSQFIRVIPPGETVAEIPITTLEDTEDELDESIRVRITSHTKGIIPFGGDTGTAIIVDDDAPTVPTGTDDSYSVEKNGMLTVDQNEGLLANDTEGAGLNILESTVPGQLSVQPDGSFVFTPAPNFSGRRNLTYLPFQAARPAFEILPLNGEYRVLGSQEDPVVGDPDFHSTWQSTNYNDEHWDSVNRLYSDSTGDSSIVLPTTYLRREFEADAGLYDVQFEVRRDDGAIIYLNGNEIFRTHAPAATGFASAPDSYDLTIPDSVQTTVTQPLQESLTVRRIPFLQGRNVLAVSLHNVAPDPDNPIEATSDLYFSLSGVAIGVSGPEPVTVTINVTENQQPPQLQDDRYSANEGSLVDSSISGVSPYGNDSLFSDIGVPYIRFMGAETGDITGGQLAGFNQNTGHFVFQPDPKISGLAGFSYRIRDNFGWSDWTRVNVLLEPDLVVRKLQPGSLLRSTYGASPGNAYTLGPDATSEVFLDIEQPSFLIAWPQNRTVRLKVTDAADTPVEMHMPFEESSVSIQASTVPLSPGTHEITLLNTSAQPVEDALSLALTANPVYPEASSVESAAEIENWVQLDDRKEIRTAEILIPMPASSVPVERWLRLPDPATPIDVLEFQNVRGSLHSVRFLDENENQVRLFVQPGSAEWIRRSDDQGTQIKFVVLEIADTSEDTTVLVSLTTNGLIENGGSEAIALGRDAVGGKDSEISVVATLNPDPNTVVFGYLGDIGNNTQSDNVAALVKSWKPDFVLGAGDVNYGNNEAFSSDWTNHAGRRYGEYILRRDDGVFPELGSESVLFFPAVGNHDSGHGAIGGREISGYLEYYFKNPGGEPRLPTGEEGIHQLFLSIYKFRWGEMEFFVMDSPHALIDQNNNQFQQRWLREKILLSDAKWKFVVMHHAPYVTDTVHNSRPPIQWHDSWLEADAILAANSHVYERSFIKGQPYLVSGLGGKSRYNFARQDPWSIIRYNANDGAVRVDANSKSVRFRFFTTSGRLIDDYSIGEQITDSADRLLISAEVGSSEKLTIRPTAGLSATLRGPSGELMGKVDTSADSPEGSLQFTSYSVTPYTLEISTKKGSGPVHYVVDRKQENLIPDAEGYDLWAEIYLAETEQDTRKRNADPDVDQWSNFLEYSLGTDPLNNQSYPSFGLKENRTFSTTHDLVIHSEALRPEIAYAVEASADLREWTPVLTRSRGAGDWILDPDAILGPEEWKSDEDGEILMYDAHSHAESLFIRLRIEN